MKNCDPYKDMVIVEVDGQIIGYNRASWWKELSGTYVYEHFGNILPEWREKGIGRALLLASTWPAIAAWARNL